MLELEVRGVCRLPDDCEARVIVGSRDRRGDRVLLVSLGAEDMHALRHELRGQATNRTQTVELIREVAAILGGVVTAIHLVRLDSGEMTGALELHRDRRRWLVPIPPGPALASAVGLGLPLRGEDTLLPDNGLPQPELAAEVQAFLESLDVSALEIGACGDSAPDR